MEMFSGQELCFAIGLLERMRCYWASLRPSPPRIANQDRINLAKELEIVEGTFRSIGAPTSAESVNELRTMLINLAVYPEVPASELVSRIEEIGRTNRREFSHMGFLSVPSDNMYLIETPEKDWETVVERFPKTRIDIEECSLCLVCSRFGAAIFHVLLVAEFGVIEVAKLFGVAGDKPGWGSLDRLEKILKKPYPERSALEQQHFELLKQVLPLMLAMKDSWRHKITHVDNKLEWLDTDFSSHLAKEIISAVRGFMRRLATDLPKDTK